MSYDETNPLKNHVKNEIMLSQIDYNHLLINFSNKSDVVAYRGLSFRTKKEYESFKELLDNGDYKPSRPESFSRNRDTAESFARNKKTFFFYEDNNIALENTYKNITDENLSVYAGIVIEVLIPKGKGVDVNRSDDSLEDEIIYQTSEAVEYNYTVIESFENQLKNNPFNINEYIQENGIEDNFSKYIMSNHQDELTQKTQLFILDEVLSPINLSKKTTSYYIDEINKNVIASETIRSLRDDNSINIRFHFPDILQYYKRGVFSDTTALTILEDNANKIIEEVCEYIDSERNYGDREEDVYYDLSYVNETSHLASNEHRERLKEVSLMASPKHYDDINEEIRELNYRTDLSQKEKEQMFQEKANEIKDFIESRINGVPKDKTKVEQEIESKKNKNNEIKKRINRLRNS